MIRSLVLATALLFAACRPGEGRRLVVAVPTGPSSITPNGLNEEFTLSILSNVFETLVDLDPRLTLRPGLAESWHTPDDRTWVFRLREGIALQDGRVLTSTHVARSLEHARSDPASRRRAQLAALERIEILDARTVVLVTRVPFDPLPARLSTIHIWAPSEKDGTPVGTGPYRLRSWSAGGDAVLEAFAGYRLGKPGIGLAEFRVVKDPKERAEAVRQGRAQLAVDVPAQELSALDKNPAARSLVENGLRVLLLGLDTTRVFKDARARRAIALAIDRQALVAGPLGGFGEIVDQIASPQELGGHGSDLPQRPFDPATARRLLAEAGLSGLEFELEYMPHKYRAMDAVAAAIAKDLGAVGLRATLRPRTTPDLLERIERQEPTAYILGWISESGDGRVSYDYLLHSPNGSYGLNNGGGYSNAEVDALIEQASTRLMIADRREILLRLAQIIYDEVPVVPLYRQVDLYAVSRGLVFRPRLDRRLRVFDMAWGRGQ